MRLNIGLKRVIFVSVLLGLSLVTAAYALTNWRLNAARQARRDDAYSPAERLLAVCWPLPGLSTAIALEEELLAVQQGDLRNEAGLQSRAVVRSPDANLILEALAKGNLASFQWPTAERHAETLLQRQPGDARALWLRARARVEMQQEDLAQMDLEQAVQAEPTAFEIRRSWADVLHQLGYVSQAMQQYELLLESRPNDEPAGLALADCLQEQARLNEAVELVDALLTRHPLSVAGLVERGRLALRLGETSAAETWLRRALQQSPEHGVAHAVMRQTLLAQNKVDIEIDAQRIQTERRQAELKSQLQASQQSPEVLTQIGLWAMRTGDEKDAAGWFYSALKADGNYQPAHAGLTEFFLSVGQPIRAGLHAPLAGDQPIRKISQSSMPTVAQGAPLLPSIPPKHPAIPTDQEASSAEVQRLCAACHAYPEPETLPRSVWRKEVKQGFDFLRESALADAYPALESVVLYYERRAPEQLPSIVQPLAKSESPVQFEKRGTGWPPNVPLQPGVANANLAPLFGNSNLDLLLCETRLNALLIMKPYAQGPGGAVLAPLNTPAHSTVCDLDHDGRSDILVASLGSFFPTDDRLGKVLWLRGGANGQFETTTLLEGVGRVADVQVADFNADGRLDLIVAVFGWRNTGEIIYLENHTEDWTSPKFVPHSVDARHGAIHVAVADLNLDKRPDFVALVSQEHETVVAFLNQGDGTFRPETLFTADNPTYGCTGMELVDLDQDGDVDVLLTNGDILDRPYLLKPYHGIQWLENQGNFPFKHRPLAAMYGAAQAVAADFDGDGDLDVVAVSCLPSALFPERESRQLPSVILMEQTQKSQFALHVLEAGSCDHFSCAAGDWDQDGRVDLTVSNFAWSGSRPMSDAAVLWKNVGPGPTAKHEK